MGDGAATSQTVPPIDHLKGDGGGGRWTTRWETVVALSVRVRLSTLAVRGNCDGTS